MFCTLDGEVYQLSTILQSDSTLLWWRSILKSKNSAPWTATYESLLWLAALLIQDMICFLIIRFGHVLGFDIYMLESLVHVKESINIECLYDKFSNLLFTYSEYLIKKMPSWNGSPKAQQGPDKSAAGMCTLFHSSSAFSQLWLNWNFHAIMNIWTRLPAKTHTGGQIK